MNLLSVILLLAAGAMIGFPLALVTVRRVWPDLYDEMLYRSRREDEDDDRDQ